jgi:hypothetical protein
MRFAVSTVRHDTPLESCLSGLQQAAAQLRPEDGWQSFQAMCLGPEPIPDAVGESALAIVEQAGWTAVFEPKLHELLPHPDARPEAGWLWARMKFLLRDWDAFKQLRPLLSLGAVGESAAVEWIELLARDQQRFQLLRAASLGEFWLSTNEAVWAAMVRGLCRTHQFRQARFWVAEWPSRENLSSDTLLCISEILRSADDWESAAEANRLGLQRADSQLLRSQHECWLAVDNLRRRELDEAAARQQRIDPSPFPPGDQLLYTLLTLAVGLETADAGRRQTIIADARQSIDDATRNYPRLALDPARRRVLNDVLQRLAAADGFGLRMWAWWRRQPA